MGPLSEKQQDLVRALELSAPLLSRILGSSDYAGFGRPEKSRHNLFRAFIAKSVRGFATTEMLVEQLRSSYTLRYLCGWDAREHHCRTHVKLLKQKRKRGRRPRTAPAPEPPPPRRLALQPTRTLQANICDLPKGCDWGIKGKCEQWRGYKLHVDFSDAGVPLSVIFTSASVHESQVAIPLIQMTRERVPTAFYDLMDTAYDAKEIHDFSRSIGHVPIIDPNPRVPLAPAKSAQYAVCTTAERGYSELKDNCGLEDIRVKGHWKVFCHVMFCVIALTVKTLLNMIC